MSKIKARKLDPVSREDVNAAFELLGIDSTKGVKSVLVDQGEITVTFWVHPDDLRVDAGAEFVVATYTRTRMVGSREGWVPDIRFDADHLHNPWPIRDVRHNWMVEPGNPPRLVPRRTHG